MDNLTDRIVPSYINSRQNNPSIGRWTALKALPLQIGTGELNFYGYNLINPNITDVYLKLYDSLLAPVVGAANVIETIHVPASSSVVLKGSDVQYHFTLGMWIAFTTGVSDVDSGAPAVGGVAQITYKQ